MLPDAIAAESYKLLRNRSTLFWGFCAVPLGNLLFNLILETWLAFHNSGAGMGLRISVGLGGKSALGALVLQALALPGSFFVQIFYMAGAAALFAGEYRWETWRLLVPRNSRVNLLLAKFAIYALAIAASILALAAAALISALYDGVLSGIMPSGFTAGFPLQALGVFLASWGELLMLGALVGLVAVASRAMIGALLAGLFFSVAQTIGMALVHPREAPLRFFAYLPGMCAYLIRAWAAGEEIAPGIFADPAEILPAALFLLLWIAALAGAATTLFQRQDLSRE